MTLGDDLLSLTLAYLIQGIQIQAQGPALASTARSIQIARQASKMWDLLQMFTILATTIFIALGATQSAGDCGPTSVPNVPGCWGQAVMTLALIASNLLL